jgi:haloalkane dehalogenase
MSARFDPLKKKETHVLGAKMAFVEHGTGDPIVFLHGNPTSSYLWRKVIPELGERGRCIAPDLIGMGDSQKIGGKYRFSDHAQYLEAFLDVVGVDANVTLVVHDWGGPLGFDWGRRHSGAVNGVAYTETIVTPLDWDDWGEASKRLFQGMRSDAGDELVLTKNVFVEKILPGSVIGPISEDDMTVYRKPYLEPGESRRPTLTWPREIPLDGEPPDVKAVVEANEEWLAGPNVPKLFINAKPGAILFGRQREVCRSWENQTEVTVPGIHFVQEDSGPEIGQAVAVWMNTL